MEGARWSCWRSVDLPVGDDLDEANGDKDREHATAGSSTPGLKGELVVELRARKAHDLLLK